MKSVDVVIPAYNEAKNLNLLLGDVVKQSIWSRIGSVMVISDASTDETENIVREIASKNKKIVLVTKKERSGKSQSLNTAFRMSSADVIVMLDADIRLLDQQALEFLIEPLKSNSKIGLTALQKQAITNGAGIASNASALSLKLLHSIIKSKANYNVNNFYGLAGCAAAIRKNLYKKITLGERPGNDQLLFLLALKNGFNTYYVDKSNVLYRPPTTVRDYLSQGQRNAVAATNNTQAFPDTMREHARLSSRQLSAALLVFLRNPYGTLCWAPLYGISRIKSKKYQRGPWKIATSTK